MVGEMSAPAAWMPGTLEAWQATLDAYERGDREWLATRMDAFAKYEILVLV